MQLKEQISKAVVETDKIRNSEEFIILQTENQKDRKTIKKFLETALVVDQMDSLLEELYEIRFPSDQVRNPLDIAKFKEGVASEKPEEWGNWVYYSWSNKLVHFPPEEIWEEVRTARNKTLITAEEQSKFWNFKIGIAGLSVGQSSVIAITRSGGCKNIKLADFDALNPTNLNRLDGNLSNCGTKKATVIKQKVLELDPYYNIEVYEKGITEDNIDEFFTKGFKLDAVIDAMDSIPLKIKLRLKAKQHKIPVIMATDSADGVLLDIERYDLEPEKAIFGGRVDENLAIKNKMDFIKTALKIISPDYITLPMADAMGKIGTEIPTHPQLGSSAIMSGAVTAYVIRKLSIGISFLSDRTHLDLEQLFNSMVHSEDYKNMSQLAKAGLKKLIATES